MTDRERLNNFNKLAISQGKSYAQLQQEESVALIRSGKLDPDRPKDSRYDKWLKTNKLKSK